MLAQSEPEPKGPATIASQESCRTLHQADYDTINEVIRIALLQVIMPEIEGLQARLGLDSHDESTKTENQITETSRTPEISTVPQVNDLADNLGTIMITKELTKSSPTGDNGVVTSPSSDPSSPSKSLRKWFSRTTDTRHRSRLEELIQEADEVAIKKTTCKTSREITFSHVTVPVAEVPVVTDDTPKKVTELSEKQDSSKQSGSVNDSAICDSPVKVLGNSPSTAVPPRRVYQTIATRDHSTTIRMHCLAELKATLAKNKSHKTREKSEAKGEPLVAQAKQKPELKWDLQATNLPQRSRSHTAPPCAKVLQDETMSPSTATPAQNPAEQDQMQSEQTSTAALDALTEELTNDVAELRERLRTIPNLVEKGSSSKLGRPNHMVAHGPREIPTISSSCLTDCFRSGRTKRERARVEELLAKLLDSIDGLKSDLRAAEISRSINEESPFASIWAPRATPEVADSFRTTPVSPMTQALLDPPSTRQALVTLSSGTGGISYAVSAQGAGKKLGRITVDRPKGARMMTSRKETRYSM